MERPCRTTLAPIFTNFSRSVMSDQLATSAGSASVLAHMHLVDPETDLVL